MLTHLPYEIARRELLAGWFSAMLAREGCRATVALTRFYLRFLARFRADLHLDRPMTTKRRYELDITGVTDLPDWWAAANLPTRIQLTEGVWSSDFDVADERVNEGLLFRKVAHIIGRDANLPIGVSMYTMIGVSMYTIPVGAAIRRLPDVETE